MSSAAQSVGDLQVALSHAGRMLETDAALAAEQAAEILRVAPGHPIALLIAGIAARGSNLSLEHRRVLDSRQWWIFIGGGQRPVTGMGAAGAMPGWSASSCSCGWLHAGAAGT